MGVVVGIILSLAVALGFGAGDWHRDGTTRQQSRQDMRECRSEAKPYSHTVLYTRMLNDCMYSRGYRNTKWLTDDPHGLHPTSVYVPADK